MSAALLLVSLILLVSHQQAQTLSGTVTDSRDAVVQNAEVTTVRDGRVVSRTRSDAAGSFSLSAASDITGLLLRVSSPGFTRFEWPMAEITWPVIVKLRPLPVEEDVTIAITRTDSTLSDTPASIVLLDRRDLDAAAAQTIDDTLRQIPGFTLFRRSSSRTSNPTAQGANLRGVGGSGAARTAVQFDGVSLNDSFGGWTYWSRVPRIAIDQVEVLRGAASALFGSAGLSGGIDLASRREFRDAFRFEGSGASQGSVDGGLFAALDRLSWLTSIAAESSQTNGYIPVASDDRGIVDTRARSRHNSVLLSGERWFGPVVIFGRANLFTENRDNGTALTNNRTYYKQATAGANIMDDSFGAFKLRTTVDGQVYDQTFSAVSPDRSSESLTRIQRVPSRSISTGVSWSHAIGRHTLAAQGDLRYVRGFSEEVAVSNGSGTTLITSGGKESSFGIFGQDYWKVTPRLSVSIAGRYDRWREFGGLSRTRSLISNLTSETIFPERDELSFSPRAAAIYKITESASAYGSYSQSFRAPTLNELYRSFRVGNVLTLANESLTAERARTFEGGVIVSKIFNRVKVRANVFQTHVADPVVSVTLSSTPTLITRQRRNVGETRTRGFEIDSDIEISPGLDLNLGYLYADSRVVDAGINASLIGKFLPQVARQQFTARAAYRLERLTLSAQARASDAQFDDDLNTFRLRPYFTMDAYTGYRLNERFEIFGAVENVFDSRYDIGLTPVRTIAAPRYLRAGFRIDLKGKKRLRTTD